MSHSLVLMSVFFILGILIGNRLPLAPGWLWAVLAVLMVAGAVSLKLGRRALGHQLLLALVLTAGALRVQIASPWIDPTHYLSRDRLGPGRFQVQVVGDPFSGADQIRAPVEIRSVIEGERWVPLSGQARLLVNAGSGPLVRPAYGEVLELDGVLESPGDRFVGPGRRLKDQWASEGFHAVLKPTGQIKVQARDRGSPIHASLYALRHRISGVLDQTHPPEVAALIRALLLGIRDLAPEVMADYRITGTYHILSISGCHVALVAVALAALFTGLKAPRKLSAILIVVVLIAYAFMTGESPSVLRATFMACVFILGQLLARPLSIYTSLAFSAIALLLIDPLSIFTASFQLSFLAVLSIAYLTPPLMTRLDFLPPYLNSLVSTSLSASLGTAPVLATSFGSLSLVSPLANLVVVPLFGIIMPIAMLAIVGSLFSPWVPFFFGAANYGFVTLQHRLIHGLAQVPFASVDVSEIPPVVWVVYSLVLVILGDYHNLREVLASRGKMTSDERPALPASDEIDPDVLARTARELACLLPDVSEASDPIAQRLAAVRGMIRAQTLELAPEFLLRCEALTQCSWATQLDPLTVAYLGLSEAYFLTGRSPDKGPALLLLIKALEHELNIHVFGPLRLIPGLSRASTVTTRFPKHPLVLFLTSPPRSLSLEEQNELLWSIITVQDRPLKALARGIQRGLASGVADPNFFLDPSRFPLRLDQVYKRFYLRLDKEPWDWEGIRRARDEILGPKQENLFEQIGRALTPGLVDPAQRRPDEPEEPGSGDPGEDSQPLERFACAPGSEGS